MTATRTTARSPMLPHLPDGVRPATDWPAPRLVPTSYPGRAPDHPYLLIGDEVVPLQAKGDGGRLRLELPDGTPVDAALEQVGATPLGERVPVLAYGANRSPHTLAIKFSHHAGAMASAAGAAPDGRPAPGAPPGPAGPGAPHTPAAPATPTPSTVPAVAAVPVLRGTLDGLDVVAAGLSSQGYLYADVVPSPGTRITTYVTLLDRAQAAAVHESEGVGKGAYDCAWMRGFRVEGTGVVLDTIGYAGCMPVFVSPASGQPLAFSAVDAVDRRFDAFDQVTLFGTFLEAAGILDATATLLGPITSRRPESVAAELARMLSGQWWYRHNTGDSQTKAAVRAQQLVWDALLQHCAPESTAQRLAAEGAVIEAAAAYAAGPGLRLAAQTAVV